MSDADRPIEDRRWSTLRVERRGSGTPEDPDVLVVTIDRPENVETTALGAAYLAGMDVGVFDGLNSVLDAYRIERSFEPKVTPGERESHLRRWRDAVRRARTEMGIT